MSEKKTYYQRKQRAINTLGDMGKLPPQAIDMEIAVLGACLLEKEGLADVIDIVKPESFYKDEHQKIFAAIQDLHRSGKPIDILTVTEILKAKGDLDFIGGPYYISELTNRISSSANAEYHARIVQQKFIARQLIRIGGEIVRSGYDDGADVFDLINEAESSIFNIHIGATKNYESAQEILIETIKEIESAGLNKDFITGVPSGYARLDKVTGGFQKTDLIIIAARPGMGKSALMLGMARNAALDFKKPIGIFSLEMSSKQLMKRLIAGETDIYFDKLRDGKLEQKEWEFLNNKIGRIAESKLFIDDTPSLGVYEFRRKARKMVQQHKVEMIIVDYLQLMTVGDGSKFGNKEQEISKISSTLKAVAKELDIPIIALSQLSRKVEERGGKKIPMLSDLRDSGAIEQDADIVAFIYRPEYYGYTVDEAGTSTDGVADIIIAKHRNGSTCDVQVRFIKNFAKFTNWDESYSFPSGEPAANYYEVNNDKPF